MLKAVCVLLVVLAVSSVFSASTRVKRSARTSPRFCVGPKGGWDTKNPQCKKRFVVDGREATWAKGRMNCREMGELYEIAIISTPKEEADLEKYITDDSEAIKAKNSSLWIGLVDNRDEGEYRWAPTQKRVTYNNWAIGEPKENDDNDCVRMDFKSKRWHEAHCDNERYKQICQYYGPDHSSDRDD